MQNGIMGVVVFIVPHPPIAKLPDVKLDPVLPVHCCTLSELFQVM